MSDCCSNAACEVEKLRKRQLGTLKAVLFINLGMFFVEMAAGILAGSTALLADSLDMLGDAFVYAFSIYVVFKSDAWKAAAALFKGWIMAAFGCFVLAQAVYKMLVPAVPNHEIIGLLGAIALAANGICLFLLWKHRAEDINMRSVWLCSRNDMVANVSVLCAGAGVWLTASQWPDIVVGLGIAALFLRSASQVIREAAGSTRRQ